jgi:hypothetical protein
MSTIAASYRVLAQDATSVAPIRCGARKMSTPISKFSLYLQHSKTKTNAGKMPMNFLSSIYLKEGTRS